MKNILIKNNTKATYRQVKKIYNSYFGIYKINTYLFLKKIALSNIYSIIKARSLKKE